MKVHKLIMEFIMPYLDFPHSVTDLHGLPPPHLATMTPEATTRAGMETSGIKVDGMVPVFKDELALAIKTFIQARIQHSQATYFPDTSQTQIPR